MGEQTITIGSKEYKAKEARTDKEKSNGLRGVTNLPDGEGMLFYMSGKNQQEPFTMTGMQIPLDIVFINQDQEVVDVKQNCQPGEKEIINSVSNLEGDDYINYVLEVNPNSGIKNGDFLDFNEKMPVMKVLFPDGSEQMALYGGERIFSRKNTKILIKKAKKADSTQSETDLKALGKYMFKCIKIQDERDPEYVETPTKQD